MFYHYVRYDGGILEVLQITPVLVVVTILKVTIDHVDHIHQLVFLCFKGKYNADKARL